MAKRLIPIIILVMLMLAIKPLIIPAENKSFKEQEVIVLLAMLIWGEARGCSFSEQTDVACVVRNRVRKWHKSYKDVILQPYQFSCFNVYDVNYPKLINPLEHGTYKTWLSCFSVALLVYKNFWITSIESLLG